MLRRVGIGSVLGPVNPLTALAVVADIDEDDRVVARRAGTSPAHLDCRYGLASVVHTGSSW